MVTPMLRMIPWGKPAQHMSIKQESELTNSEPATMRVQGRSGPPQRGKLWMQLLGRKVRIRGHNASSAPPREWLKWRSQRQIEAPSWWGRPDP